MLAINAGQSVFEWMDEKAIAQSHWIKEPGILSFGQKKYVLTVNSKSSDEIEITISKVTQSAYQRFKSFLSSLSENEKWRKLFDKREYTTTFPVGEGDSESIPSTFSDFREHFQESRSQIELLEKLTSASDVKDALAKVKSCVEERINAISSRELTSRASQPVSNLRKLRGTISVTTPITSNRAFLTETKVTIPIESVANIRERYSELFNRITQRVRERSVTETERQELVKEIGYLKEYSSSNSNSSDEIQEMFDKLRMLESEVKAQLLLRKPKGILKDSAEVKVKPRRNVTFDENTKNDF